MRRHTIKHHLEILPATLLSKRAWQNTARSLPTGAYLIVTNPKNQRQVKFMLKLAQLFRNKGKKVIIWPAQLAWDDQKSS